MERSNETQCDAWAFFTETVRSRAPTWKNAVTLRSVEMFTEYEPGSYIGFISPTPLLLVVALQDNLTVADEALAAYERCLEPKKLADASRWSFRRISKRLRRKFDGGSGLVPTSFETRIAGDPCAESTEYGGPRALPPVGGRGVWPIPANVVPRIGATLAEAGHIWPGGASVQGVAYEYGERLFCGDGLL